MILVSAANSKVPVNVGDDDAEDFRELEQQPAGNGLRRRDGEGPDMRLPDVECCGRNSQRRFRVHILVATQCNTTRSVFASPVRSSACGRPEARGRPAGPGSVSVHAESPFRYNRPLRFLLLKFGTGRHDVLRLRWANGGQGWTVSRGPQGMRRTSWRGWTSSMRADRKLGVAGRWRTRRLPVPCGDVEIAVAGCGGHCNHRGAA
jgi:hypothetical protein